MKPSTYRRTTRTIPETAFQQQVLALAKLRGWLTAHFRPGMDRRGNWSTAVAGDGSGFPDTILIRGTRLVIAELKSESGRVAPEQRAWLDAWRQTGAEVFVWRPSDFPAIEEALR